MVFGGETALRNIFTVPGLALTLLGNTSPDGYLIGNESAAPTITFSNTSTYGAGVHWQPISHTTDVDPINDHYYTFNHPVRRATYQAERYKSVVGTTQTGENMIPYVNARFRTAGTDFELMLETLPYRLTITVDGVRVLQERSVLNTGTVSSVSATTATLSAGATGSTDAGIYAEYGCFFTTGPAAGTVTRVRNYDRTTRIITVDAWAGATPNNGDTYEIRLMTSAISLPSSGSPTNRYLKLAWATEKSRLVEIEILGAVFYGIVTSSAEGQPIAAAQTNRTPLIVLGDSFTEPTGSRGSADGIGGFIARSLGLRQIIASVGSTGWSWRGTGGRLSGRHRLVPPVNSWQWHMAGKTAGTWTVTIDGVTTTNLNHNATYLELQNAVRALPAHPNAIAASCFGQLYLLLVDSPDTPSTIVLNVGGLTSGGGLAHTPTPTRYYGDVHGCVPRTAAGKDLSFFLLIQLAHNDANAISGASLTQAQFEADIAATIDQARARFPSAIIITLGPIPYTASGTYPAQFTTAQATLNAVAAPRLRKIAGWTPNIDLINVNYPMNGTGTVNGTAGTGLAGIMVHGDGVHMAMLGHEMYGEEISRRILEGLSA